MAVTPSTKVFDLIQRYPFMLDFLAGYRPELAKLRNPLMRNTIGRIATMENVAEMAGVTTEKLISDIEAAVSARGPAGDDRARGAAGGDRAALEPEDQRLETLKGIIRDLHAGRDFQEVKRRFGELVKDVDYSDVAAMEQQLIREGLPETEIKRLCDVHVAIFKESLEKTTPADSPAPPGHPIHTFRAENEALGKIVEEMRDILAQLDTPDDGRPGPTVAGKAGPPAVDARLENLRGLFKQLSEVNKHYLRKENQLFPALEEHGVEGPPKVMWAIHDDIRALLKSFGSALERPDVTALKADGEKVLTMIADMIYKEEHILFPMSLDLLDESDWVRIRQGEDDVGYALVRPGDVWKHSNVAQDGAEIIRGRIGVEYGAKTGKTPRIPLDTGLLTVEQVNLLLRHLPVDVSFVDDKDEVCYYSEGERIFPRSAGVIGRKVQNCHPPKSVDVVQKIVDEFKAGTKDVAEFWIRRDGKFVHIRYFAVRDAAGKYQGTLEVVQDVTKIRELTGERRLLDW